ncbi:MAG: hypothetical protein HFE27_05365 [Clostridia bacterium]|nr:hypothetical protein [Clostridia bacterium]
MKKRFVTTLTALIACIACVIGLVACGGGTADPVAGKTYVFEKVEITKGATGLLKEETENQMNRLCAGSEIEFGQANEFTMSVLGNSETGTYQQNGATLTLTVEGDDQTAKVKGDYVTLSITESGMSVTMYYKLQGGNTDNDNDNDNNNENEDNTNSAESVAGKTYAFKDLYFQFDSSVDQAFKDQMNATLEIMKSVYVGSVISFNENGGFSMTVYGETITGTYVQNGTSVTATPDSETSSAPQTFKISENQLSVEMTIDTGTGLHIVYEIAE